MTRDALNNRFWQLAARQTITAAAAGSAVSRTAMPAFTFVFIGDRFSLVKRPQQLILSLGGSPVEYPNDSSTVTVGTHSASDRPQSAALQLLARALNVSSRLVWRVVKGHSYCQTAMIDQ